MREFWTEGSQADLPLTPAQATLTHEPAPHCELLPEGSRVCYARFNVGMDLIDLGLPLVHELHGRPEDIIVANFGQWHFDEPEYRYVCHVLAIIVMFCMVYHSR